MALRMSQLRGLGDHLPVGPQYLLPAQHAGVSVIQRGPHGKRLAPVGDGLTFWSDQLYQPGEWTPTQRIVGVMGMGALESSEEAGQFLNLAAQAQANARQARSTGDATAAAMAKSYLASAESWYNRIAPGDQPDFIGYLDYTRALVRNDPHAESIRVDPPQITQSQVDANLAMNAARISAAFDRQHSGWALNDPAFSPLPGAIQTGTRVLEAANAAAEDVYRKTAKCLGSPVSCWWNDLPAWAKLASAGAAAAVTLTYFGGFIQAAGKVANRLANPGRKRRKVR